MVKDCQRALSIKSWTGMEDMMKTTHVPELHNIIMDWQPPGDAMLSRQSMKKHFFAMVLLAPYNTFLW